VTFDRHAFPSDTIPYDADVDPHVDVDDRLRPTSDRATRKGCVMSCHFDELVGHVAALLIRHARQDEVDRFLEILLPEYRAEVLAAAQELVRERRATR
jgi:hypothetical protein